MNFNMFNQEKEKYQLNNAQIYSKCIKKLFPTTQFGQWSKVPRKVQVKYASILNSLTMNIQKSLEETPILISKKSLNRNKEIAFGILFKNAVKELNINLLHIREMVKQDIAKEQIVIKKSEKKNHLFGKKIKTRKKPRPAISFDSPTLTRIPSPGLLVR